MKTKNIRHRIRGVKNTRKITHAMELVAATKMRRTTAAVLATRRYAELAWELLQQVRQRTDIAHHPLLEERSPVRTSLLFVVAGNRGLVGAFNQKLVALALAAIETEGVPVRVVTAGRVAARLLRRLSVDIIADFPKKDVLFRTEDAAPIADEILRQYVSGAVDRVRMVYADFHSPVRQEPRVRTLLPVGEFDPELGDLGERFSGAAETPARSGVESRGQRRPDFLFEPSPEEVLTAVVPNLLSLQVYQALLETTASEHAARMVAMKNATDNADEIAEELTLTLNQARQQQITRELQEIVSALR